MDKIMQIADFLSRKSMFPVLRKGLNLLFCASITSYIFEKFYFKYSWLEITDYKGILNFFVKGNFIVPFSIFVVVFIATYFISYSSFAIPNYFKSTKWQRKIIEYKLSKSEATGQVQNIQSKIEDVTAFKSSEKFLIGLYNYFKKTINQKEYIRIQRELQKLKDNLEANYILSFRAIITIIIYFISIDYFGWLLFSVVMILLILYMLLLIFGYRLLDILPTLIGRFVFEVEKYIKEYNEINPNNT
jgi:ABC-type multidrug transport system fused ATPase/permease subunit